MKNCPKCNNLWPDEHRYCPECGVDLVPESENSNIRMGNANAISGGVHSSDDHSKKESDNVVNSNNETHNNSHNTTTNNTHNTTIYEAEKSASEKLKENCLTYRLECKELFNDGLISNEGERKLRELQVKLGLADELISDIKEEVRQQSKTRNKQLSLAGRHDINQTKSIIEQNTEPALQRQLDRLESWMQEYDDNTLKFMYYQMSSMLEPVRYTNRYEDSVKDEYWEAYWAYIAYLLQNKEKQASDALASLGRWHSSYPEQNDTILLLAGLLMQNESIENVQQVRNQLTTRFTSDLQLLLDTMDELLQIDWMRETICIRPTHAFYVNTLFKQFVDTQKLRGEEFLKQQRQQKEQERIIETKRIHEQTLVQQAAAKAKAEAEAERLRLEAAEAETVLAKTLLDAAEAESKVEKIRLQTIAAEAAAEKDRLARAEAESRAEEMRINFEKDKAEREKNQKNEAETRQRKIEYKKLFDQNRCDVLKTCTEVGISSSQYHEWRKKDPVFNDEIAYIIRKYKQQEEEHKRIKRKESLQKNKPYIRAALILVLIVLGYAVCKTIYEKTEYIRLCNDFDTNFKKIEDSYDGYDYISKNCNVIIKMRTKENSFYFTGEKSSNQSSEQLKTKIKNLINNHKPNMGHGDERIRTDAQDRVIRLTEELNKL